MHMAPPLPAIGAGGGNGDAKEVAATATVGAAAAAAAVGIDAASTSGIDVGHRRGSVAPAAALVGASAVVSSW